MCVCACVCVCVGVGWWVPMCETGGGKIRRVRGREEGREGGREREGKGDGGKIAFVCVPVFAHF